MDAHLTCILASARTHAHRQNTRRFWRCIQFNRSIDKEEVDINVRTQTHTHLSSVLWPKVFNPAERFQCHLLSSEMSFRQPAGLHAALCKYYFQAAIYRPATVQIAATCVRVPSHTHQTLFFFFSFHFLNLITPTHSRFLCTRHNVQSRPHTQAINQRAQGQFRLDVTFKVLFSLYIQYTSQKYTVNLQRRATRYAVKSARREQQILFDEDYKA